MSQQELKKRFDTIYAVLKQPQIRRKIKWGAVALLLINLFLWLFSGYFLTKDTPVDAIAQGDGLVVYGISGNSTPQYRTWTSASASWSSASPVGGATFAGVPRYIITKASHTRNEIIVGTLNDSGTLFITHWNGTSWSQLGSNISTGVADARVFDITYENTSGDAMVVVGGAADPSYYIWNGSTWSGPTAITEATRTTGTIRWIEIESRVTSGSDHIALAYADNAGDLNALIWSGSGWTQQTAVAAALSTALENNAAATTMKAFDLAYESLSGDLLIVWGNSATADPRYVTYTAAGTWSGVLTATAFVEIPSIVDLASEPWGNRISAATVDDTTANSNDGDCGTWDGSAWVNPGNCDIARSSPEAGDHVLSNGWVKYNTDVRAIGFYSDADDVTLDYNYWVPGTGWTNTQAYTPSPNCLSGAVEDDSIQTDHNPFNNAEIMVIRGSGASFCTQKTNYAGANTFNFGNAGDGSSLGTPSVSAYRPIGFSYNKFIPNQTPTITVNEPAGGDDSVYIGQTFNINYDLNDPDNTVTAAFYYDTDTDPAVKTAISGPCAIAAEGAGATCAWDTTGVSAGNYYVYGVTNDGINGNVFDYSSGTLSVLAPSPALRQMDYHWRNNDGGEPDATSRTAGVQNDTISPVKNVVLRLRFGISNEGTANHTGASFRLEYSQTATCSSGTYTPVPVTATTEHFNMADATGISDGVATTNIAIATGGVDDENTTFVAGQFKESGNTTSSIALSSTQYTDIEYSFLANNNAQWSTHYCFKVTDSGTELNQVVNYAELTTAATPPNIEQVHYRWRNDTGPEAGAPTNADLSPAGNTVVATGWTNATNAYTNDNTNVATATPGKGAFVSNYYETFGFDSIPSTATVNSVTLYAQYYHSVSATTTLGLTPYVSGVEKCAGGTDTTYRAAEYEYSIDVSSCGSAWTPSDLTNANFKVLVEAGRTGNTAVTFSLDYVWVRVNYTPSGADFKQNEDVVHTGQAQNENIRLRLMAKNTGGNLSNVYKVQYVSKSAACSTITNGWTTIPVTATTEHFEMTTTEYFTDQDATQNINPGLTDPAGSFVAGHLMEDQSNVSNSVLLTNSDFTELEYNFQAKNTSAGTYCFRLVRGASDTLLDLYSVYPELGIASANNPPSSPSGLSQPVSESAYTNDNTPQLSFTVSDPDGNNVKYHIQIADNSSFTTPLISFVYGSYSASGTTFIFTVGSYGSGTCTGTCPATLPDSDTGYWWRVKGIDDSLAESSYVEYGLAGTVDFKVSTNTAPNNPSSLSQKKTTDTVLNQGSWTNETSVKFEASASDANNPDTLYLCIEKDPIGSAFSGTEDSCSAGVAFTGSPLTISHVISTLSDGTQYHWQARIKDGAGAYSGWVPFSTPDPNWVTGRTGTVLDGKYVYNSNSSAAQWKTSQTNCTGPQCATGLDSVYPSFYALVGDNTVDFSEYPARNSCKLLGGRLPYITEFHEIVDAGTYGALTLGYHWTATEVASATAVKIHSSGSPETVELKDSTINVRCVADAVAASFDFGVDSSSPSGGIVKDGSGADQDWNNGSLTAIEGNWTGTAPDSNASGINKYEYAIRRASDGWYWNGTAWQAGESWTNNGTGTSFTKNSMNLSTGVSYYISLKTTDNAGNFATISSNGQQVSPTLSFSLDSNTVTFDDLNNINNWTSTKTTTFTTSTNASNGYSVKAYVGDYLRSLSFVTETISDFIGTWLSPQNWANFCKDDASDCGFGYTSNDTTIQGSNKFQSGTLFSSYILNAPGDIVADHTEAINGTTGAVVNEQFTVTHKVSVPTTQTASKYQTNAFFIVTANY